MFKLQLYIAIVVLALCCAACQKEIKYTEPEFPTYDTKTLTTTNKRIVAELSQLSLPTDFVVTDSCVVVIDPTIDEFLYVFDKNNGQFIKKLIKRGRGPYEMISPSATIGRNANHIAVLDTKTKSTILYPIKNLKDNDDCNTQYVVVENSEALFSDQSKITNNIIIKRHIYDSLRFSLYDLKGQKYATYRSYPTVDKNAKLNTYALSYASQFAIKPDQTKLCEVSYLGAILEIINIDAYGMQQDKILYISQPIFDVVNKGNWVSWNDDTNMGFLDIDVSENYIYALYVGGKGNEDKQFNSVMIFDWSGNPIKKLVSDQYLMAIVVDQDDRGLYAIAKHNGEYSLCYYDL